MKTDKLVHIADMHFWRIVLNPLRMLNKRVLGELTVIFRRQYEFAMELAEPFADAVAATGASDVILTGDFASTALPEEFELAVRFIRDLLARGMATHVLAGNHDVYTFESVRRRRFEQYFGEFAPTVESPTLTRLSGGTPLILVPTVCPRHLSARGHVSSAAIETVARLLEQAGPRVIVAAHYPILAKTYGYDSNLFRRLDNAESLREALGESGREILYVSGHVHRFSFVRDPQFSNIHYLTTGGFFRQDKRTLSRGEFSEIDVFAETFSIQRHMYIGENWAIESCAK